MNWTTDIPSESGYYWWRPKIESPDQEFQDRVNNTAEIVYVGRYPESFEDLGTVTSFWDGEEPLESYLVGLWSKIELPECMKKQEKLDGVVD